MMKQSYSPIQELSPENDKSNEDSNFIGLVGYETSLTKEILDGKDGPLAKDYKVLIYKHGKLEQVKYILINLSLYCTRVKLFILAVSYVFYDLCRTHL